VVQRLMGSEFTTSKEELVTILNHLVQIKGYVNADRESDKMEECGVV